MKLTNDELFAAQMAVSKKIDALMKARKAEYVAQLEGGAGDRHTFYSADGTKLGLLTMTAPKVEAVIIDEEDALGTLRAMGLTKTVEVPVDNWQEYFEVVGTDVIARETGEVAAGIGCKFAKPSPRFTSFKEDAILDKLAPKLGGASLNLLMGGEE